MSFIIFFSEILVQLRAMGLSNKLHSLNLTRTVYLFTEIHVSAQICKFLLMTADWLKYLVLIMTFTHLLILSNAEFKKSCSLSGTNFTNLKMLSYYNTTMHKVYGQNTDEINSQTLKYYYSHKLLCCQHGVSRLHSVLTYYSAQVVTLTLQPFVCKFPWTLLVPVCLIISSHMNNILW